MQEAITNISFLTFQEQNVHAIREEEYFSVGTQNLISRPPGKHFTNITHSCLTLFIKVFCNDYGEKYGPFRLGESLIFLLPRWVRQALHCGEMNLMWHQ